MWIYLTKTFISALIIVIVTETAKRSGLIGGLIKSLPLISLISFIWLYLETRDIHKVSDLSVSTFWFVLPTLPLFLIFPHLLRTGMTFWGSLGISLVIMLICYGITFFLLEKIGLRF